MGNRRKRFTEAKLIKKVSFRYCTYIQFSISVYQFRGNFCTFYATTFISEFWLIVTLQVKSLKIKIKIIKNIIMYYYRSEEFEVVLLLAEVCFLSTST